MQVHCPECSARFDCEAPRPGAELACPGCAARFKISAKETVLFLEDVRSGTKTMVGDQGEPLAPDAIGPGMRLDGYMIERELGRGGMGVVYLAKQLSLGRRVAIKVLPPELAQDEEFLRRFLREAKALAELSHPHIIAVIDKGCYRGLYYIAMEYVEGVSVRDLLEQKAMSAEDALRLVPQICGALEYAHGKGVIHRDIKPDNILVDRLGNARLADFGLSKLLGETELSHITRTKAVMGTYDYMAPEQRTSARGADHRSDLYSLGVVLYEMLTGQLPAGNFALPSKHDRRLDAEIDRIVMRVLERDPANRYQKASEIAIDMERAKHPGAARGARSQMPERVGAAAASVAAWSGWGVISRKTVALVREHKWWFMIGAILLLTGSFGALTGWLVVGVIVLFSSMNDEDDEEEPEVAELVVETPAKPEVPAAPRTSWLAHFAFGFACVLAVGGLALALLAETIAEGMLGCSLGAQAGILVAIAAGGIPGVVALLVAGAARRRAREAQQRGGFLAVCAVLIVLGYLTSVGVLWTRGFEQMIKWRAISRLALEGDRTTLDGLEHETLNPASPGTQHIAARLLATASPERVAELAVVAEPRQLAALFDALLESSLHDTAITASLAGRVIGTLPGSQHMSLRYHAYELIHRYHPDNALPALIGALETPARNTAASAIVEYKSRPAVPALLAVAMHAQVDRDERGQAVAALATMADAAAARALVSVLRTRDPVVMHAAEQALVRLLGHPSEPNDTLEQRADGWLRLAATLEDR